MATTIVRRRWKTSTAAEQRLQLRLHRKPGAPSRGAGLAARRPRAGRVDTGPAPREPPGAQDAVRQFGRLRRPLAGRRARTSGQGAPARDRERAQRLRAAALPPGALSMSALPSIWSCGLRIARSRGRISGHERGSRPSKAGSSPLTGVVTDEAAVGGHEGGVVTPPRGKPRGFHDRCAERFPGQVESRFFDSAAAASGNVPLGRNRATLDSWVERGHPVPLLNPLGEDGLYPRGQAKP